MATDEATPQELRDYAAWASQWVEAHGSLPTAFQVWRHHNQPRLQPTAALSKSTQQAVWLAQITTDFKALSIEDQRAALDNVKDHELVRTLRQLERDVVEIDLAMSGQSPDRTQSER